VANPPSVVWLHDCEQESLWPRFVWPLAYLVLVLIDLLIGCPGQCVQSELFNPSGSLTDWGGAYEGLRGLCTVLIDGLLLGGCLCLCMFKKNTGPVCLSG